MVCPKCGSPVEGEDETCPNCGADLDRSVESLEDKSEDLRKMSQELKAVRESTETFSDDDMVGDRFEIEEFIGRGPFGEVYRARDAVTETDVALKMFDEDIFETPPHREQFLEATRAAREMTQENVVRLHDSGVYEDHPWVSMQYLEGLTLEKTIELRKNKDEQFTLEEVEPIVTQVTLALQHIGREFAHGALEPSNIFKLPDLLKVTDGYLLAALPEDVFGERLEGSTYLAPEVVESDGDVDARCDVYSLGAIIREMLFGTEGGDVRGADDASGARQLCERATALDPDDRYPSVEALSEDFSTLVDTGSLLERGSAGGSTSPEMLTGKSEGSGTSEPPESGSPSENSDVPEPPGSGGVPAPPGGGDRSAPSEEGGPESQQGEGPVDAGVEPQLDRPNAEFPEEAVATEDYERQGEPGDHGGPTRDMDRSGDLPGGGPPGATEEYDRGDPLSQAPTEEVDRGDGPPSASGPDLSSRSGSPGDASPRQPGGRDDDSGGGSSAAAYVMGAAILIAAGVGALFFWSDRSEEEVVLKGSSGEETEQPDAGAAEEPGVDPETVEASLERGTDALRGAVASARAEAEQNAEKSEDDGEESAGSGGRESGTESETESAATGAAATGEEGGRSKEPEEGTECPDGMALVEVDSGNYCIDRYEYPGPGQKPLTNVTWFKAQAKCKSQGKRLCTQTEFGRACGAPYPWGDSWNASKCNTQDEAGFPRSLAPAGEFKECRSWPGVYDMVGNAHEWVKEQKIAGGGFDSGKDFARCGNVSPKSPGSATKTVGFRCCADPE